MSAITSLFRRALLFLPFTLPLWLAPNLPTLTLSQATRTLLYMAAAFAIPVTMDLVGGSARREAFADRAAEKPGVEYGLLPRLLAFKFIFIEGLMLYYVWKRHAVGADVVILAVLVGLYYGAVGIAVAHELMHRSSRLDRWLGDLLLCTVSYSHFAIEHVYGHHIRVATPDDPASARLGESLYAFVPRSVVGGLRSAWAIEVRRLKARGRGWFSVRNRMLGYLVLVAAWYVGAYVFVGVYGVAAVAIQSAVAIFSLETINYLQHYGLQRKQVSPGRYERPGVQHCWNWETRFSGLYFLNLGRHSEHHRSANRRFDALRVLDGQPRLPGEYCFAGNVVLLGACDVIIATKDSSIGIGGPAVIEGGGLGAYAPGEVGPVSIQEPNGVIDILVEDEVEATAVAKRYLSYFQGPTKQWSAHDQRILRHIVPENRRAVFDLRKVVETLADVGTMLEIRPRFGVSMLTAFIRIEGRPVGVIANNSNSPTGGAIDSDGADKASRFMQLCDAFDIPILSLIDTPGNMVGPEAEKTALIRHCGRMYLAGANVTVPFFGVVLRKSYGLGALAMSTGSFDETFFTVSWPTGEFAGMGLEGAIKLGRRAELLAITDLAQRKARYDQLVADAYDWAKALNAGMTMEVDDVIDPAQTRKWLVMGLELAPKAPPRTGKKRAWVDSW